MKKIIFMATAFILLMGLLVGCGKSSDSRKIVDCSGTEVEIPNDIEKVVNVSPSAVAFMTAMNLEDLLIGTHGSVLNHAWSPIFYDGFSTMTKYGYNPNAEELISADVDLVILQDASYAEELRKSGVAAVCFDYTNKDELYKALDMLGEIFGDDVKSYVSQWKDYLDSTIEKIAEEVSEIQENEKCNVYYVNAAGAEASREGLYSTYGGGSFVEYWVNAIGANLVTSPYKDVTEIDQELALSLDPDAVFTSGWLEYQAKDIMMSDPLWQDIPAVKNDKVFVMPTSMVSYDRFAVELPMLLDYSASLIYPEYHVFGGIQELKKFYEKFYNRTFSDEQLEYMMKGLNPDGTKMGE